MARRIIAILILVTLVLGFLYRERILAIFEKSEITLNQKEVKLLFKTKPEFAELLSALHAEGVIDDVEKVRRIALKNDIDTLSFCAGKYIVLSGERIDRLMNGFTAGPNGHGKAELLVNVDFYECRDLQDVAGRISSFILPDSLTLLNYMKSPETLAKYQFTLEELPAIFLPRRYQMYFDTEPVVFMDSMAATFKLFWNEERKTKAAKLGLKTPSQAATLASIVYSEQGKLPEEWPIIAGLYLNRLKKGMKLQSDPTFKFCWGRELDGVQRLLAKHRNIQCPYNTYQINGLPPGPIHLVTEEVIEAVLNPSEHDFLFMCAKPDYSGAHNFTASAIAHEQNARAYRRWLSQQ